MPRSLHCILLIWTLSISALAKQQPAKRDYAAEHYYVLELDDTLTRHQLHAQASHVADSLQARLVEQVGELEGHFLLSIPSSFHPDTLNDRLDRSKRKRSSALPVIRSLEKQIARKRVKRVYHASEPALEHTKTRRRRKRQGLSTYIQDISKRFGILDPLFPKQWHIANDQQQQNSINVTGVWAQGITGTGVRVALVDDGLDMHSDDLAANFFAEGSWDYNDHTALPEPRLSDDQHGTRCAGEIAAGKNDVCGIGVAYDSKVAGIRILSGSISDADEASALNYAYQENDIYSCSWGPPDDGKSCEAPSRLIVKAMLNGVTNGRAGKGSLFVFASGNGGAVEDQCNFDGYTNSIYSITVGAVDREGLHPFYSEACSAVMVVTFSSGSGDNIHTTDVGKRVCASRHGGTSAAAPLAAGIFALVLQVRPDLTWRDMQHLCVNTALKVNEADPDWSSTHVGRPFNHKYGYGNLDTWRIVEAAKTWKNVKPQAWYESQDAFASAEHTTVALTEDGVESTINIQATSLAEANFDKLEHVTVRVHIEHQRRGNIEVVLTSPNGIVSSLARSRKFDEAEVGLPGWQFMSVKHWDENPIGVWTLKVLDRQDNDKNGSFTSWSLSLWGSARDADLTTAYKLPHDDQIHLPPSPTMTTEEPEPSTETEAMTWPGEDEETSISSSSLWTTATSTTKTYAKPTDHLPDDHASQQGHSTLALDPTRPTDLPLGEDLGDDLEDNLSTADPTASSTTFFGHVTSIISDQKMLAVGIGTGIILIAGLSAFFILRRRSRQRNYSFERVAGNDTGLPMSTMSPATASFRGVRGSRTRDLYDAFGVSSDSDSEEGEFKDDKAMESFLEDDKSENEELPPTREAAKSSDALFTEA